MIKARNSRDLPVTDNPFHNMETLKKYGRYNGDDSGFVDAEVDDNEIQSNRKSYFSWSSFLCI